MSKRIESAARRIEAAGRALLMQDERQLQPCQSLWPLGRALVETALLFRALEAGANEKLAPNELFDGGESAGPNIDTRLRFLRDLCSSSTFTVRDRASAAAQAHFEEAVSSIESPGETYWIRLVTQLTAINPADPNVVELGRLLDDVYTETERIANALNTVTTHEALIDWDEILRAINHVRDHYDYAEEMIIECIRPAL